MLGDEVWTAFGEELKFEVKTNQCGRAGAKIEKKQIKNIFFLNFLHVGGGGIVGGIQVSVGEVLGGFGEKMDGENSRS